jgi:hypothetical protein
MDGCDSIYAIKREDLVNNRMVAEMAGTNCTYCTSITGALLDLDLEYAEPVVDKIGWTQNNNFLAVAAQQKPRYDSKYDI